MRKTAGFLKVCATLGLVLEILVAVVLVGVEVFFLAIGSFSDIAAKTGNAITIEGGTMTPAEIDALKPFFMVGIATALIAVIFAIIGTIKIRKTLGECKEERPFSDVSVTNLRDSARVELIGGCVGIIGSIVLTVMAGQLTINGRPIGSTMSSLNLTFLFNAVEKYLFYHVAKYGKTLENR